MVQYIFTPWRNRRELLAVRQQFYPEHHHDLAESNGTQQQPPPNRSKNRSSSSHHDNNLGASLANDDDDEDGAEQKQQAVARVSMWMQRGGCPHMVESTALLTAAILSDEDQGTLRRGGGPISAARARGDDTNGSARASRGYAVRAAYAAAFSRFVTGLLDSHQDKQRKMSMYDVAKSVGLPATFVELRHQATHEQLPSLTRLRAAARNALAWIWDYYWRHLQLPEADGDDARAGLPGAAPAGRVVVNERQARERNECRQLMLKYLAEEEEIGRGLREEILGRYDEALVLTTLDAISGSTRGSKVLRGAVALSREVLERGVNPDRMVVDEEPGAEKAPKDVEMVRAELGKAWEELKEVEEMKMAQDGEDQVQVDVSDDGPSWMLYEEEAWVPKPIGVL